MASVSTQCPNIDTRIPASEANIARTFECADGSLYRYFDHVAPDGSHRLCQFCRTSGRHYDPFVCLNETEWRACPYLPPMFPGGA